MKTSPKQLIWVIFPIILIFWLYKGVLKANFNWEDAMFLGDAAKVLTKGNLKYIFLPWHGEYARFFRQPVSVIFYKLFGYNATPFFTLSLFFHLTNIFLVYLLALKLTQRKVIAFFSSLLYGIYQVNFECLIWISAGSKDLPMTTFFLLSFLFFDSYLNKDKLNDLFFAYLFFFLCFSCEFKSFLVPLVLLIWEILSKKKLHFKNFLKYFPFLAIEAFWILTYYKGTFLVFSGVKNWSFWQAFPASLPFYFLPTNRVFWVKIYTNAWRITAGHSDELFIKEFGSIILFFFLILYLFLKKNKENKKSLVILFLICGVFLNYLPVMLTILSNYQTLWQTVTINWRYFNLASSLASILEVTSLFWFNEEILKIIRSCCPRLKLLFFPFKLAIFPLIFLSITTYFYIEYDRFMLNDFFLKWSIPAKEIFWKIKKTYPAFAKDSVLVIEGVENQSIIPYFEYRYLFENIFALYVEPNNPNYSLEIQNLPFDPREMFIRKLIRLKYYTNLKDFLVGNYRHIYQEGNDISWMTLNLPLVLPAYDRLFLGAAYGFYNPEKIYVLNINEDASIEDLTVKRSIQLKKFLAYFCLDRGKKYCFSKKTTAIGDPEVKLSFEKLSLKGQEVFNNILNQRTISLPDIYNLKI